MIIFKKTFLPRDWAWPGPITLYSFDFENICSYSQWQSEGVSILSVDKSQWHVRDMSTLQVMTLKSNVITRGLVRPSQKTGHHDLCDALCLILWPLSYSKTQSKWGLTVDTYFCPHSRKGKVRWWKHKSPLDKASPINITNLDHPFSFHPKPAIYGNLLKIVTAVKGSF